MGERPKTAEGDQPEQTLLLVLEPLKGDKAEVKANSDEALMLDMAQIDDAQKASAGLGKRPNSFLLGLRHDLDSLLADPKGRDKHNGRNGGGDDGADGDEEGEGSESGSPTVARSTIEAMVLRAEDTNRDRWGSALFFN